MIYLFNTLSRRKEPLKLKTPNHVTLYACGPTVYHYAHIGNFRTYLFVDFLVRTLQKSGLSVNHVMNITDVGHLESDNDAGDDKMMVASKREAKSPWEIARHYEEAFLHDFDQLGLNRPKTLCRATQHIDHMIKFIQKLEEKGFTYTVNGNVYFAIDRHEKYTELARRDLDQLQEGARVDVDPQKQNPLDFVLWFSQSKYPNQIMQWDSPWGRGFPGWHIECSAMASHYLGDCIDIHCGGIDHIPVHHTNEIAQSDCCFGKQWVTTWLHSEFLTLKEGKMSKSSGSFLRIKDLIEQGYLPQHFRYLCFSGHYRSPLNFTDQSMQGAKHAFEGLRNRWLAWSLASNKTLPTALSPAAESLKERFWQAMYDDINSPKALAVLWEAAKSKSITDQEKRTLMLDFDQVLGFHFQSFEPPNLCEEHKALIDARTKARMNKDFNQADAIRNTLKEQGIEIKDMPEGTVWYQQYKD